MQSLDRQGLFASQFYLWSLNELHSDFSEGFPRCRRVRGYQVLNYFRVMDNLMPDQKWAFASVLLKGAHWRGCALTGNPVTENDQKWLEWDRNEMLSRASMEVMVANSNVYHRQQYKVDKRVLTRRVREELARLFGGPVAREGTCTRYEIAVEGFLLVTHLEVKRGEVTYDHSIFSADNETLIERWSVLSWLGLINAAWTMVTDETLDEVARNAGELCGEFVEGVTGILRGLR
jgi:hypothetical protein